VLFGFRDSEGSLRRATPRRPAKFAQISFPDDPPPLKQSSGCQIGGPYTLLHLLVAASLVMLAPLPRELEVLCSKSVFFAREVIWFDQWHSRRGLFKPFPSVYTLVLGRGRFHPVSLYEKSRRSFVMTFLTRTFTNFLFYLTG